jgi:hypothetical protein
LIVMTAMRPFFSYLNVSGIFGLLTRALLEVRGSSALELESNGS